MVPGAGLEPARPLGHWILNPACLPIPPPGRGKEDRKGNDHMAMQQVFYLTGENTSILSASPSVLNLTDWPSSSSPAMSARANGVSTCF